MLTKFCNYNKLVDYYEKNKNKNWREWLSFDKIFNKPGKQGIVGLLKSKEDKDIKYVFKMSQYMNHLVYHELVIMKGLSEISSYCPHFCKGVGYVTCDIDPNYKKSSNPFEIKNKYPIKKDILLCEFIDKSCKFYNYIRNKDVDENILYSIIKQVLMAITIAQKEKQFTHYDLHSFNVMIKKCKNKDVVFLYKLDDENQFCVPTLGYYPVIIDYGFSYISDMNDSPLWTSLAHTDAGFMSDRFDWVSDPKLFLVTVSDEIKNKRGTKKSKILRRVVKNIFNPLSIDWECGWDTIDEKGAADYVTDLLRTYNTGSKLFDDYDYYCIDLIQTLIILPLEEQDYSKIGESYKIFINEWIKIENEISNPFYNLYLLKELVDTARVVRADYMRSESRNDAINHFRQKIYKAINSITKFCVLKDMNFDILLCSVLVLSKNIEGLLYNVIKSQMADKEKEYKKLPLQSVEQIYAAISSNISDEYVYSENTNIVILDRNNKSCNIFKIPENEVENINSIHNMAKGTYIYDLFKQTLNS